MTKKILKLSALLALWCAPAYAADDASQMDVIIVEDTQIFEPGKSRLILDERAKGPVTDGGDLLMTIPGISASRMGGHGADPVIRGQSHNRLNILLDGTYVHGGCPNRMDPPSSYGTSETYDEIEIIKGSQTVQHGGGGSGGTVLFKRNTERFTADKWYRGKISGGYRGNSDGREGFADLAMGNSEAFARVIGNYSSGEDYEDGDGNSVRAAYEEMTGNLILGWTPSSATKVEVGYEATRADDVTYAGAGMDTPYTDHDAYRLKFNHNLSGSMFHKVEGQLSYSTVDHLMDNYSLRTPAMAAMYMRAPSTSDTLSGRIDFESAHGDFMSNFGINYHSNERDAIRYRGTVGNVNTTQSYLWPDVTISSTGLYGETEWAMSDDKRMKFGLRYDHVRATADKTTATPTDAMGSVANLSAAGLYTIYYGGNNTSQTENNVGGILRFEKDYLQGNGTNYVSLSRSVRTADATERYLASNNNSSEDSRWVGNPFLKPEKHHQLEIGTQFKTEKWGVDASAYYNRVNDFILRDRDHSVSGAGNATVYRNVSASLIGSEISLNRYWNDHLVSGISMAYVYGENRTDDRALAQISPFEMAVTTDYKKSNWSVGGKVRMVSKQNRVDDDTSTGSGLDSQKTPGFTVADLHGSYTFDKGIKLKIGINNIFDKFYTEHLNQSSTFDTTQTQVNEPGRSIWMTAGMDF
ncbi:MAG: TonB-dependent copper receptor [Magnetococcales bacterium]|nr:TonB-dependent copper receptor [Magnetococcales bacterium]